MADVIDFLSDNNLIGLKTCVHSEWFCSIIPASDAFSRYTSATQNSLALASPIMLSRRSVSYMSVLAQQFRVTLGMVMQVLSSMAEEIG
ncbi:hypothetical protein [Dickeya solani]|uniref:Uncharacterized protein n=2 Tax=Dickeya solani TaxID=1089444 RepID=A0ABU4EBS5_9GAMM|nr:hypothetical protein [Dickeya solani]ANE76692.1 hypothetical protein A4U42_15920 [Dickeya solani IPO 2222]AUH07896.1 hypothetical protein BJD21_05120 [Dickeya solani D s0432-1]AUH11918.1 hypothetical protein BJJ98_05085 [Dickeya solani]AYQ47203.1 hypothetical protein CTB91_01387 [Dickeya solani]AYQ51375.1 hypothetical protein DSOL99_01393 [Dickeya solani]